jgi:4'-phosphopantetheinyl transferase
VAGCSGARSQARDRPVELWLVDLESTEGSLRALDGEFGLLSDEERGRAIADAASRRDMLRSTARLALRLLIARHFGEASARAPFQAGEHGKPMLAGLDGDFNVAHSGQYALIALGGVSAIGVDLEIPRSLHLSEARRAAMADAAIRIAQGAPLPDEEDARTLQAWARLEALAKADGTGIGRTLSQLGVWGRPAKATSGAGGETGAGGPPSGSLAVCDLALGRGLFAAVALPRGIAPPAVHLLPSEVEILKAIRAGASFPPDSGVDLDPAPRQKGPHRSVAQPG